MLCACTKYAQAFFGVWLEILKKKKTLDAVTKKKWIVCESA